ncbi:MAG: hypothetical protein JW768_03160 [Chitinispirillaceae bacterium]|nr:hypothetical protein [Chitinispirillaceae bacterium]
MSSVCFTCGNESYQVSKIIYAGPVTEIPEDRRRNGSTHSFKIITGLGAVFSYYQNEEAARKSRSILAGMLDAIKPTAFKRGIDFIDPKGIVKFGRVVQFKQPVGQYTHGFVITLETAQEQNQEVWVRYKSEDHATKGWKALWASIYSANGMSGTSAAAPKTAEHDQTAADETPF